MGKKNLSGRFFENKGNMVMLVKKDGSEYVFLQNQGKGDKVVYAIYDGSYVKHLSCLEQKYAHQMITGAEAGYEICKYRLPDANEHTIAEKLDLFKSARNVFLGQATVIR